jgi:hypothetical protein
VFSVATESRRLTGAAADVKRQIRKWFSGPRDRVHVQPCGMPCVALTGLSAASFLVKSQ